MEHPLRLRKKDRIRSKRLFARLFEEGSALYVYPIRLVYLQIDDDEAVAVSFGVAVPKRIHKKAVIRNLIKRRLRESIRTSKPSLLRGLNTEKKFALLYIYLSRQSENSQVIASSINRLNKKLIKQSHGK